MSVRQHFGTILLLSRHLVERARVYWGIPCSYVSAGEIYDLQDTSCCPFSRDRLILDTILAGLLTETNTRCICRVRSKSSPYFWQDRPSTTVTASCQTLLVLVVYTSYWEADLLII